MADENRTTVELSMAELREIAGYAVACAEPALAIFERDCPGDRRARDVLDEARRFVAGGDRTKALRVTALAAHRAARAAREMGCEAAVDAARAAGHAGAAAYLHPLAKATQVLHILGAAAHAARAIELDAGDDRSVGADYVEKARGLARPAVVSVLMRSPNAPGGGGRAGELGRSLDASLRWRATERSGRGVGGGGFLGVLAPQGEHVEPIARPPGQLGRGQERRAACRFRWYWKRPVRRKT